MEGSCAVGIVMDSAICPSLIGGVCYASRGVGHADAQLDDVTTVSRFHAGNVMESAGCSSVLEDVNHA
jgi:hypothetical protein